MAEQGSRYRVLIDEFRAVLPTSDTALLELYLLFLQVAEEGFQDRQTFFDRYALSEGKLALLMILKTSGQLTPSELAEAAGVTAGTITGLLAGLERAGLVFRTPHPEDGRKAAITLAPAALVLCEQLLKARARHIEMLLSMFTLQEQQQLRALLTKLHLQLESRPAS
jgi:Transcriptional regulators